MATIGLISPATVGALLVVFDPDVFVPLDLIQLDLTVSETTSLKVEWTDHPIENGQSVTDFGIVQPRTFNLVARISGSPWSGLVADAFSFTRVEDLPRRIEGHMEARRLFSIQTRRDILDNYALTDIDTSPVNGENAVDITMAFKLVRMVASVTVSIPPLRIDPGAADIASPPVDAGTAATAAVPQSTAAAATDVLAGVFGG